MGYLGVLSGRSKQKIKFGAQMGDAEYVDVYINAEVWISMKNMNFY